MERAGNFSFRPLLVYMEYFIYSIFQSLMCNKNAFLKKKYLPQTYIVLTKEHGQNKQTNCKQSIKNAFQKCREYATTIVKKIFSKE